MLNSLAYSLRICFLNLFLTKELCLLLSILKVQFPPATSAMLNTCANGVHICSTVSFCLLVYIPSPPDDFFSFILLIVLDTTSGVTTNCPNLSPSGPLNFVSGTGNELLSSLVNTELKCKCNSSAIENRCVITYPTLSSSGPTLHRTFCLLITYAYSYSLLLFVVLICAQKFATFELHLSLRLVPLCKHHNRYLFPYVYTPARYLIYI